jgi:hypothetical protein
MHDNAFLEISDVEASQKLSDRINLEDLHKVLDAFAKRYCPAPRTFGLSYTWTVYQIEYATDVMFKQLGKVLDKKQGDLEPDHPGGNLYGKAGQHHHLPGTAYYL